MPDYRLYRLDGANRITGADVIIADTDEEAVRAAHELKVQNECELWQGNRLVAIVDARNSLTR